GIKTRPTSGRKPKHMAIRDMTRRISKQRIAEQRASKKYPNCEVIGSYWIGEDGINNYYEVIMADTKSKSVTKDKNTKNALAKKGRAERGLTSAGKKGRGLKKGKGHEKNYPSLRAHSRKAK
ncbi:MAG: 50S ribosomal protein L15e, partial [Candidatus Diapherotrites archaeon]